MLDTLIGIIIGALVLIAIAFFIAVSVDAKRNHAWRASKKDNDR